MIATVSILMSTINVTMPLEVFAENEQVPSTTVNVPDLELPITESITDSDETVRLYDLLEAQPERA